MPSFLYQHRVRNHEVDAQGFVFNSRYLEMVDTAFTEFMRSLGWDYPVMVDAGFDPSVITARITYSRPLRLDETADIQVACERVGTSSLNMHFSFYRNSEEIATIALVYVNVDTQLATAVPIPEIIREQLQTQVTKF